MTHEAMCFLKASISSGWRLGCCSRPGCQNPMWSMPRTSTSSGTTLSLKTSTLMPKIICFSKSSARAQSPLCGRKRWLTAVCLSTWMPLRSRMTRLCPDPNHASFCELLPTQYVPPTDIHLNDSEVQNTKTKTTWCWAVTNLSSVLSLLYLVHQS